MKKMCVVVVLLALCVLVGAVFVEAGVTRKQKEEHPLLSLLTPRIGQVVIGKTVTVQVFSSNTKIKQTAGKNKQGEGHLKITVDNNVPITTAVTTYRLNIGALSEDKHAVTVELVQNDGTSFSPPVVKSSEFSILRSGLKPNVVKKQERRYHPGRLFTEKRI